MSPSVNQAPAVAIERVRLCACGTPCGPSAQLRLQPPGIRQGGTREVDCRHRQHTRLTWAKCRHLAEEKESGTVWALGATRARADGSEPGRI